jgi:hypothetical protein
MRLLHKVQGLVPVGLNNLKLSCLHLNFFTQNFVGKIPYSR